MKNIHVLPTDKPSRIFKLTGDLHLHEECGIDPKRNQNIHITSDEEIKVNDYITDGYKVWKWKDDSSLLGRKKIILTTDQDLIKDGVQAIDDEFLEWFVNNPSCESVEVRKECCGQCDERLCEVYDRGIGWNKNNTFYEIIIPKEELKKIFDLPIATNLGSAFTETMKSVSQHEGGIKQGEINLPNFKEEVIKSEEDAKIFVETMENIPEPNDKLKKAFRDFNKLETREYDLLQHIKFCLECKNDSQAIRLIEKYGFEKQEERYSLDELRLWLIERDVYLHNYYTTYKKSGIPMESVDKYIEDSHEYLMGRKQIKSK